MTRMFEGDTIPGLVKAAERVLADRPLVKDGRRLVRGIWLHSDHLQCPTPIQFDELDRKVEAAGITDPRRRQHLLWLVVNDPRVVGPSGKMIRRYTPALVERKA